MSEIMTYTKKMFDPLRPNVEQIDIEDIAHALSMLCRANGHFKTFYSVAQLSINCAREAKARGHSDKVQLACLLHDASEAYLSDITRPVKAELPRYKEIEAPLQEMIWIKWLNEPLTKEERKQVFDIDDAILIHEFLNLMDTAIADCIPEIYSVPNFAFTDFDDCKRLFVRLFNQLAAGRKEYFTVGIDWMKGCWLAAEIREDAIAVRKFTNIEEISKYYLNADVVMIDIPIGLPENVEENMDRPDEKARAYLSVGRKSTVFPVPCRQAVNKDLYEEASAENERVLGKRLPSQSFGFSKMIRQVDVFIQENSCWKNRLLESHPEVAFQMLNGGKGLRSSKHTEAGLRERIAILQSCGMDPTSALATCSPKQYTDALDAICLAVSARFGCEKGFCTIPNIPACDRYGIKMQMVFGR